MPFGMEQQKLTHSRKLLFLPLLLFTFLTWMYYSRDAYPPVYTLTALVTTAPEPTPPPRPKSFLVWSSRCTIPNLDPFNSDVRRFHKPERYTPCTKVQLLTYVTKVDNIATLRINKDAIPSYSFENVTCCYANVSRGCAKKEPDGGICVSSCRKFNDNVTMHQPIVTVKCHSKQKEVYSNTHATILLNESVMKKINASKDVQNPLSVLFVGIDSISRLSLIRGLPKTYEFLKENNWTDLKGYNKIADNTFPNLMAIFVGLNESDAYKKCNPGIMGALDRCDFIWKKFDKLGYITAYAEDEAYINTFNYHKKGFVNPPTDYYFRPYMMASEKLKIVKKDQMSYCTGPETSGERILNIAKEFAVDFKDYLKFGLFWMNTFSHNELNSPTGLDTKVRTFLEELTEKGVLENHLVVFFSDHGIRFGEYRYTREGWLEERLPSFFISLPKWFQNKHPVEYAHLQANALKLTTPYDVHMTLQDVLKLTNDSYTKTPASSCPDCRSLFQEISSERSCEDAQIAKHWCTCTGYKPVNSTKHPYVQEAAKLILKQVGVILKERGRFGEAKHCAKFNLSKVISASISDKEIDWYKNETYLLIVIETKPKAVFEATVEVDEARNPVTFKLSDGISRLDYYGDHSWCIGDAYLKRYCYCR